MKNRQVKRELVEAKKARKKRWIRQGALAWFVTFLIILFLVSYTA